MFNELLDHLTQSITKHDTNYRKAIELGLRLALTLRHLATGESYHCLCFGFRVPHNNYSIIVRQVCEAIVDGYAEELLMVNLSSTAGHNSPLVVDQLCHDSPLFTCARPYSSAFAFDRQLHRASVCD